MDFNSLSLFNAFSQLRVLSQLTVSVFSFGTSDSSGLETVVEVVEARVVFSGESSTPLSLHCRKLEADIVMYWL